MNFQTNDIDFLELFKNPSSKYRAVPFWSWNCKLNNDILSEQIDAFKKMGFGGFHMHSRTGLADKYLGEEFMNAVKFCVHKAEKNNMLACLYDEDRYSSGFAGGYVTKKRKYRARKMILSVNEEMSFPKDDAIDNGKTYLAAVFDVCLDSDGRLRKYTKVASDEKCSGTKWYAYIKTADESPWFNNQTYVDTLSKEAIDEFINITYGSYENAVGTEFGQTIPSIFTDEPHCPSIKLPAFARDTADIQLPWSFGLDSVFEDKYGYNLIDKIPEIIWDLSNGISVVRYHFRDFMCDTFVRSYVENCHTACEKTGLYLMGHIMGEDGLDQQTMWIGDAMRAYKYFDIPGIDVLCDSLDFIAAKQCRSIVNQYGKKAMACELYGVTNWNFDFRGHKRQGDWLAAFGVTVRVPHLAWVSMAGESKRDYPAPIGCQSPWHTQYSYIENHFARVNTALTRGKQAVRIAVIHPIESYWLKFGPNDTSGIARQQIEQNFSDILEWLMFSALDFDYIDESLLPEQFSGCDCGALCVGKMEYDAVIVPGCKTLRTSTIEILKKFIKTGGKVIVAGEYAKYADAQKFDVESELAGSVAVEFNKEALLSELEPFRDIWLRNSDGTISDNLVYSMRRDSDCNWLFVAHGKYESCTEDTSAQHIKITVKGIYTPQIFDTLSGEVEKAVFCYDGENTVIDCHMYQNDSVLIKLDKKRGAEFKTQGIKDEIVRTVYFSEKVRYHLCEPNVLLLDRAAFSLNGGEYCPEEEILKIDNICRTRLGYPLRSENFPQPWVVDEEKILNYVCLKFIMNSVTDIEGGFLAVENAENLSIRFNSQTVENKVDGYFTDHAIKTVALPKILKGKNILELKIPFGKRDNLEWCYILGKFNVRVEGAECVLEKATDSVGFSDLTAQGMPFYGGNIVYETEIETPQCDMLIHTVNYRGALVKVFVDGKEVGISAFAPYTVRANDVCAGKHTVEFKLYGTRINTFGGLHNITRPNWVNSNFWRTDGDNWCYEYNFWKNGILSSPRIDILKK